MRSGKFATRIPHVRTIRRRLAQFSEDTSGPWKITDASGEEAALVLPFVAFFAAASEGRITQVTNGEAKWIVRLRRIFPEMRVGALQQLVRAYNRCELEKADTNTLDLLLGFRTWESNQAEGEFLRVLDRMYPDPGAVERQRILSVAQIMEDWASQEPKEPNTEGENATRAHVRLRGKEDDGTKVGKVVVKNSEATSKGKQKEETDGKRTRKTTGQRVEPRVRRRKE